MKPKDNLCCRKLHDELSEMAQSDRPSVLRCPLTRYVSLSEIE